MTRCSSFVSSMALLALCAVPASAQSVSIGDLFPTGVDAAGMRLAGGSLDPHYSIVNLAGSPQAVVIGSGTSASDCRGAGTWIVPGGQSCWVWQTASGLPVNTTLIFRTTFNLTGLDPFSAFISGSWATDNFGDDILINGMSTGNTSSTFTSATNFSISSGFNPGLNTLDFIVRDAGAVSGFLVQSIEGRANRSVAVPEPASAALVAGGLLMLFGAARRRRAAV